MKDRDLDEMIKNVMSEDIGPSAKVLKDTKAMVRNIGKRKMKKDYILIAALTVLSSILFLVQGSAILYKLNLNIFQIGLIYSFYGLTLNGLLLVIYYNRENFVKFLSEIR